MIDWKDTWLAQELTWVLVRLYFEVLHLVLIPIRWVLGALGET